MAILKKAFGVLALLLLLHTGVSAGSLEEWIKRYDGGGGWARDVAVDSFGNAYVTGASYSSLLGYDIVTIKYDSNGNELWVQSYNGGYEGRPRAIEVDSTGNVYVAAIAGDSYWNTDYVVIKYDTNGNELWSERHGDSSRNDLFALAIDPTGNAYITGSSYISSGAGDYLTMKYDSNGNELWAKRYDGGANDSARSVAVDASGNAIVAGASQGPTGYDSVTIKYDNNGNEVWLKRYSGSVAVAAGVDSLGNVYVTGYGDGDYLTMKYDTHGNELWVNKGDIEGFAQALALDSAGNVYVAGSSSDDFATVKYDTNGNHLWTKSYNGGANDGPTSIAVDSSSNVYVTGWSYNLGYGTGSDYVTIRYDANGNEVWVDRLDIGLYDNPFALVVDTFGNAYIAGMSGYVTIKYPVILGATIDIKPGSYPNSINIGSKGVVPVAVLTTDDFNATVIDADTVYFAGAPAVNYSFEDVNGDGRLDIIFHFKTQDLQLDSTSTTATLMGKTLDNRRILGIDTVRIISAKK